MGASHNTGSDTSIATIQNYLHKNPEYEEFLKRLFTKNLPIGVEAATINKVYGEEIIPVWEVQQGYPIDKVKLKRNEMIFVSTQIKWSARHLYQWSAHFQTGAKSLLDLTTLSTILKILAILVMYLMES